MTLFLDEQLNPLCEGCAPKTPQGVQALVKRKKAAPVALRHLLQLVDLGPTLLSVEQMVDERGRPVCKLLLIQVRIAGQTMALYKKITGRSSPEAQLATLLQFASDKRDELLGLRPRCRRRGRKDG